MTKQTLFFPGSNLEIMVIQANFTYPSYCTGFNKLKCMRMSQYRKKYRYGSEDSLKMESKFSVKSNNSS